MDIVERFQDRKRMGRKIIELTRGNPDAVAFVGFVARKLKKDPNWHPNDADISRWCDLRHEKAVTEGVISPIGCGRKGAVSCC